MPLPERRKGERHEDFMDRCMADPVMASEFPDTGRNGTECTGI